MLSKTNSYFSIYVAVALKDLKPTGAQLCQKLYKQKSKNKWQPLPQRPDSLNPDVKYTACGAISFGLQGS